MSEPSLMWVIKPVYNLGIVDEIDASLLPSDKELTPETLAREIVRRKKPISFKEIIGNNQILGLGEEHWNSEPAKHIAKNAQEFAVLGITHYCIEASADIQPLLDALNQGQKVDLFNTRFGAGVHQDDYRKAVLALSKEGIKIIAVDTHEPRTKFTQKEKESFIFSKIQGTLNDDSKLLFLIGKGHLVKHVSNESKPAWLGQLLVTSGTSISTAIYVFGDVTPAFQENSTMMEALNQGDLLHDDFMVDTKMLNPWASDQLRRYEADYWIHLNEDD